MKKIISVILVIIILLSGVACKSEKDIISNNSSYYPSSQDNVSSNVSNNNILENVSQDNSSDDIAHNNTSNTTTSESDLSSNNQSSNKNPDISSSKNSLVSVTDKETSSNDKIQNNNSNILSSVEQDTPANDLEYYEYNITSYIIDYLAIGDIIYLILERPDFVMIINADNGEVLKRERLETTPGDINFINGDLWVSFPSLKQIRIYDTNNFTEKNRYSFEHEINVFDVYNDYIVYEASRYAYRYKISTKEFTQITYKGNIKSSFQSPGILINAEKGLIYIGDSENTGCILRCFDLETLEHKNYLKIGVTGFSNSKRQIFLYDSKVYWGAFEVDQEDVSRVETQYDGSGMLFVNEDYVITTRGVYIRKDCIRILDFDASEDWVYSLVTKSEHLMVADFQKIYIIPSK